MAEQSLAPVERIEHAILTIRGVRVMLDSDLAALYGVQTKALNQAVKRNIERFPADFMFRLTAEEKAEVVTNCDRLARLKFSATLPYVFTEHGAVMLSAVLNSPTAIAASLGIARAFVRLRRLMILEAEIRQRFEALEHKDREQDAWIAYLYKAIEDLMEPLAPDAGTKAIGFQIDNPTEQGPTD